MRQSKEKVNNMSVTFGNSQDIEVTGKLAKEPEMRYTPDGKAVTEFSVPVHKYKGQDPASGKPVNETIWFNVTCWEKEAETINKHCHKGDIVFVRGELQFDPATGGPRIWTNQQTGAAQSGFKITAHKVIVNSMGPKTNAQPDDFPVDPQWGNAQPQQQSPVPPQQGGFAQPQPGFAQQPVQGGFPQQPQPQPPYVQPGQQYTQAPNVQPQPQYQQPVQPQYQQTAQPQYQQPQQSQAQGQPAGFVVPPVNVPGTQGRPQFNPQPQVQPQAPNQAKPW